MRPEGGLETGDVLLGKYQIEALLGRGGMGLVYRARHVHLNEPIAIKVLRHDVQLDEEAVTRFKREAQAAVRLKSEHVARIHDVGVFDDGSPYMVMEFLAGADLGSLVDANGPTDVPTAVDLILQACDALAEAHASGIVHRDVKPSNLFISSRPDGSHVLKILDFGISKSATGTDLSLTQTASVLGTPAYMSPEQMRSARKVDARTDIWSLGTVLYELVEGRRPFRAETFSEMCVMAAVDPHDPLIRAPELEPVIARCMAKTPEGRYQSVAELAVALAPFARDPSRAAHYVQRTQRVLGRAAAATPLPIRDVASAPIRMPVAPVTAPSLGGNPGTLSGETTSNTVQRSRTGIWIGIAALLTAGVTAAALYLKAQKQNAESEDDGAVIRMTATPSTGSSTPLTPGSNATITPGSNATITSGSNAGSNAVSGSNDASGSNAAMTGSNVASGANATGAGKGSAAIKKGGGTAIKKGGGTVIKKGGSGKGSGDAKGSAASPPPPPEPVKKPCNVWESRTGCK